MIFHRQKKLKKIRDIGSSIAIGYINEIMHPTQLWFDSGIKSQGYGKLYNCVNFTIPKRFIDRHKHDNQLEELDSEDYFKIINLYYFGATNLNIT